MRKASLTKGRGGTTFNQGCTISDPIPLPDKFTEKLSFRFEKFHFDISISYIYIHIYVYVYRKINFDFASRRRGGDIISHVLV